MRLFRRAPMALAPEFAVNVKLAAATVKSCRRRCQTLPPQGVNSRRPIHGESTLADAILDRIVHDSYSIFIDGDDSMRRRKGINK